MLLCRLQALTMPQRETVAGEATARSATSKIMFMLLDIWMISPATQRLNRCSTPLVSQGCMKRNNYQGCMLMVFEARQRAEARKQ